jgi:dipeptidyl aminopeptidase/acylaminoacyl peptidase
LTHLEVDEDRMRGLDRAKHGPVGVAAVVFAFAPVAQDRWRSSKPTRSKGNAMRNRSLLISIVALLALAAAAPAATAASPRAVVYSKATTVGGKVEGGLFAVKAGHLNQLTEEPTDTEPAFSPDGRTVAFVRGGDIYSIRPDGSGLRQLSSGPVVDSTPLVSPDGRRVVFERRDAAGAADLYAVRVLGGGLHALTSGPDDDHQADFSADGRTIVFVRDSGGANTAEDLYSMRISGAGLRRLTHTGVDEFKPRWFTAGIVYSRGESADGPAAYADVYTMRANGTHVKSLVAGVGSAYVEDVDPAGRTVLFRRDQGLWSKRIGAGRARKLAQLPDDSQTNGVFSSDGRKVAAFVAVEEQQSLVAIDVKTRRQSQLAEGFEASEKDGTVIGPVIAWQPVR